MIRCTVVSPRKVGKRGIDDAVMASIFIERRYAMLKKILIAVDESRHAKSALLYAAGIKPHSSLQMTLLNIRPVVPEHFMFETQGDPIIKREKERLMAENESNAINILRAHKKILVDEGIKENNINTVSQARELGLAKDIIEYGRKHQSDAVVIGRRGISRIQKVFMGSTSAKIMEHAYTLPVWIVDGEIRPRRFLVAVNLNTTALVDYIVRMCEGMANIHLTFFYVLERFRLSGVSPDSANAAQLDMIIERHERYRIDSWWADAINRLKRVGFKEKQMEMKTAQRTEKTGKMILEEIRNHAYDTVIMGRTGSGKAYYFGSVSRYVCERLTDHALWLLGNSLTY